jgi:peptidyl-prolyl cis-trans isomerase C
MRTTLLFLLAAAAAALVAGCNNSQSSKAPTGPVLARVNSDRLTGPELDSLAPEGFEVSQENLPKILDKWVSNTLMYQEAVRRGINKETQVRAHLERLEHDYLVNELLERLTSSVKAGQEDVARYFAEHKDEFSYEVKIMRIVLADSLQAAVTLDDLRKGGDFLKLAKERSQDVLLPAGQESKYIARGAVGDPRMGGDPAIEEAIFGLKPGGISGLLPSQEGFQIIKLTDKKKTKPDASLAETRDYIEAILRYRRSQAVVDSLLSGLRGKAKIELTPDAYFAPAGK